MIHEPFSLWLSRQRRLPYKFRRSLIKRLYPEMLKDFPFETDFFEGGLRFRGNIVNYIDRLVYFCGAHEKYMLCFLRDYVRGVRRQTKDRLVFFDVGANVGNHTLFMSRLADEVRAFEPYPRVRAQLEENLRLNRIGNVHIHPFGLSDQDTAQPFYSGPDSNLGAASFVAEHKRDNYFLGELELRHGDAVVQKEGIRDIGILKADVEGYEKFVLAGLKETLRRDRPLMIIELSPTTRETLGGEAALYDLFPPGYRLYYFRYGSNDTGRYKLRPFDYRIRSKIEDVIACPEERLMHLRGCGAPAWITPSLSSRQERL